MNKTDRSLEMHNEEMQKIKIKGIGNLFDIPTYINP